MQHGQCHAVSAHTDGVTECDRATVHVHDVIADAEIGHGGDAHGGEGFVQLEQIHVAHLHAHLVERLQDGATGLREQRRVVGAGHHAVADDLTEGLHATGLHGALAHDHHGRTTIADLRSVGGGDGAFLVEGRLQSTEGFHGGVGAHTFIGVDDLGVTLALRNADGNDLLRQATGGDGGGRALVGLHGQLILLRASDVAGRVTLGAQPHEARVERAPQSVGDDRILQLGVAVTETTARSGRDVRRVRHALHATRDHDVGVAGLDHLIGEVNRIDSRQAHLVDVHGGNVHRDAGFHRRLTAGHLSLSGHQHLTHDHVLDFIGRHSGALECGLDGEPTEIGRAERGKDTAHLADRGTGSSDDV